MGKLLFVLVVCLFVSGFANAGVGDDARVLFGNVANTAFVKKIETQLMKETDISKAARSVTRECYWLGRYQEGLSSLSQAILNLPAYGDSGTQLYSASGMLGQYCGLSTSIEQSPVEEQNRQSLHDFIKSRIQPILAQIDSVSTKDNARGDKLAEDVRKIENEVKAKVNEAQRAGEARAKEIQNELKRAGLRIGR